MPKTFFILFEVSPEPGSHIDPRIEGALGHCCIVETDPRSALINAAYKVRQSGWKIDNLETPPVEVSIEDFEGKDWGTACFLKAQEDEISLFFIGHTSAEDLHTREPKPIEVPSDIDLNKVLSDQVNIRRKGACLFYDKSNCDEVIDAHSIQRSQSLSSIAADGYVYSPSLSYGDIKKSKGKIILRQTHINSMSTFRGLCKTHDNSVFQPIDNSPLLPTDHQVFLYAYRVILRQVFVKKCAVESLESQLDSYSGSTATKSILEALLEGNQLGLSSLSRLKELFDESHRESRFSDIYYVMFSTPDKPSVAFSGGFFPDQGFSGEPIQNLANRDCELSSITFSFAPLHQGWCLLFAWHKDSDEVCRYFISTLQQAIRDGRKPEEVLFNMIVKGCENTAFAPCWIDDLTVDERTMLEELLTFGSDPLKFPDPNYLESGLAFPLGWKFNSVRDNLTPLQA